LKKLDHEDNLAASLYNRIVDNVNRNGGTSKSRERVKPIKKRSSKPLHQHDEVRPRYIVYPNLVFTNRNGVYGFFASDVSVLDNFVDIDIDFVKH